MRKCKMTMGGWVSVWSERWLVKGEGDRAASERLHLLGRSPALTGPRLRRCHECAATPRQSQTRE